MRHEKWINNTHSFPGSAASHSEDINLQNISRLGIQVESTDVTGAVVPFVDGEKGSGTVTVVDYTALTGATLTVAGHDLVEGVDWTAATSNAATALSLAEAINTLAEVVATVGIVPPDAPTGVVAVGGDAEVTLSWDAVSGADSYTVYYTTADIGEFFPCDGEVIFFNIADGDTLTINGTALTAKDSPSGDSQFKIEYYIPPEPGNPNDFATMQNLASCISAHPTLSGQVTTALPLAFESAAVMAVTSINTAVGITLAQTGGNIGLQVIDKVAVASSPQIVSGLADGTSYGFIVTARNAAGQGAGSTIVDGLTVPAAPATISAVAGDTLATITFDSSDGADSYNLYYSSTSPVTTSDTQIAGASSPQDVTGLTNGTEYFFAVTAVDASGESALSSEANTTPVAPFTPASLSGLQYWGDASLLVGSDGTPIDTLPDQSGNGRNFVKRTGAAFSTRPLIYNAQQNGLPVARFARADGQRLVYENASFMDNPSEITMFVVVKSSDSANNGAMLSKGDSFSNPGWMMAYNVGRTSYFFSNGSNYRYRDAYPPTVYWDGVARAFVHMKNSSNVISLYTNGTQITGGTTDNAGTYTSSSNLDYVCIGNWSEGGFAQTMDLCEFGIYNRVLDSTEVGQVTDYLVAKWGL